MSQSKVIRFKITEVKGAMDYNTASVTLSPEEKVCVDLVIAGETGETEEGEVFVINPGELNKLVKNVRVIAHVATSELFEDNDY